MNAPIIRAEVHTDDWRNSALFDATPWFERASDEEILALFRIGWGGDYEADAVAQHVSDLPGYESVDAVFGNGPFECRVDPSTAMLWLHANRPSLFETIARENEDSPDEALKDCREDAAAPWEEQEENYPGQDYATRPARADVEPVALLRAFDFQGLLAKLTGGDDWKEDEGAPTTGVGVEWTFVDERGNHAFINLDQDRLTVTVSDPDGDDLESLSIDLEDEDAVAASGYAEFLGSDVPLVPKP